MRGCHTYAPAMALLLIVGASLVHGAEPQVGYVYPAGLCRGTTQDVVIGGQNLAGATNLYVSGTGLKAEVVSYFKPLTNQEMNRLRNRFQKLDQTLDAAEGEEREKQEKEIAEIQQTFKEQGFGEAGKKRLKKVNRKAQPNLQIREQVTVRVSAATNAPTGLRELRVRAKDGLSNPVLFRVSHLPEHHEQEPTNRQTTVEGSLPIPSVMNGQIMPGDVDRFTLAGKKGQHLVFKVEARRLVPYLADAVPGWFQATLGLYDSKDKEVAYVDDNLFDPDPLLKVTLPEDGEYTLEIKDAIYRGREDFVYRITTRPGESAAPPTGTPATKSVITLTPEHEPNNSRAQAESVSAPVTVSGRIGKPGDWDAFKLEAGAGETLVAEIRGRRLDSPIDSIIKLTDAQGRVLAINDDHVDRGYGLLTHHADSYISHTFSNSGPVVVHVGDIQNQGSPRHEYQLRLSAPQPDFALRVVPSCINVPAGNTVPMTVHALRRDGFKGDIRVALVDPPPGFELSGDVIPAGQNKVAMTLTAPRKAQGTELSLVCRGEASINGQVIRRRAVPAEDMMQAFLWRHLVPAQDWIINVKATSWIVVNADVPETGNLAIPATGKMQLMLTSPNKKHMNRRPRFELADAPKGLSIASSKVIPKNGTATLTLKADPEQLKAGTKGNLVINVLAPNKKQKRILTTVPAIPFEIVEGKATSG